MGLGGLGGMVAGTAIVKMVPDMTGFAKKVESGVSGVGRKLSAVGGTLTKSLTLPIIGLGIAATKAFGEAQAVAAQTEAVLKSTGGAARVTADDIVELSQALAKKTAFDDEAIQSGQNLLLTFTNIRNGLVEDEKIFDMATESVLDMSQALGQDTKSSAIQLGKALNDPIKGVSALQRVGVSFTASQKEQIKAMVESGDTMGAQKLILAELSKEFGGSAEAFAKTGAGQMKQAMNELGNAGESLGAILLPIITAISGALSGLATWFQNLTPGQQKFAAAALGVVAALGPVLIIAGKVMTAIGALGPVFGLIGKAAGLLFANPIVLAIAAIAIAIFLIIKHWDKIKAFLFRTWTAIRNTAIAVFNAIRAFLAKWGPLILAILTGPIGLIVLLFVRNFAKIKAFVSGAISFIRGIIIGAFNTIRSTLASIWGGITGGVRSAWNTITGIIRRAIDAVMAPIRALRSAVSWILPGSPIPFVTGLEKSAAALRKLGAVANNVGLSGPAPALAGGVPMLGGVGGGALVAELRALRGDVRALSLRVDLDGRTIARSVDGHRAFADRAVS